MTFCTYSVRSSAIDFAELFRFKMDPAQAAKGLCFVDSKGNTHGTPFQTASAGHNPVRAARLLAGYLESETGEPYIGDDDTIDLIEVPEVGATVVYKEDEQEWTAVVEEVGERVVVVRTIYSNGDHTVPHKLLLDEVIRILD